MEITVLATGSSGNCYLLEGGSSPLLLEAGIPIKKIRQELGFGLSQVAGCLVSHEHGDHAKSVKDVLKAGVDVYATKGTIDALGVDGHRLHQICYQKWFSVDDYRVLPFPAIHDAEEPCGFVIAQGGERLLYLTDTAYSPYKFKGLTRIMLEINYEEKILRKNMEIGRIDKTVQRRVLRNHMSLERAKKFLKATDLSHIAEIIVIHLSQDNADAHLFKEQIGKLTGKVVRIA